MKKPGAYPFITDMTVIHAIAAAGGLTKFAAANEVSVTRRIGGKEKKVKVPLEEIVKGRAPNYPLKPADIIYVPQRSF